MKILITGGSGFIGSRLVADLMALDHEIVIFDKTSSEQYPNLVVPGDVCDRNVLTHALTNVDLVYHLAAEHHDNVRPISLYQEVNIDGTANLITAAEKNGIEKIVFTSTIAIYGLRLNGQDESSTPAPFNEYGRTKYEAEKILHAWAARDSKRTLVIVRPAVIFGEGNQGNVYNLLAQIASNRFIMIGRGKAKKAMGYVGNISRFLALQIDATPGTQIYNYADSIEITTGEVVVIARRAFGMRSHFELRIPYVIGLIGGYAFDLLSKLVGKSFPISAIRIKKFTSESQVSIQRIEAMGFKAPYSVEDGLKRMMTSEFPEAVE